MDIEIAIDSIDGYMATVSCRGLYEIAKAIPAEQNIVEIGSYKGRSTCCLGLGSLHGNMAKITAIDLWDMEESDYEHPLKSTFGATSTFQTFLDNVKHLGLSDLINPLKGDSHKIDWSGEIGLLHIDGDHRYEFVKKDFELWSPHVVENGYILFHDYSDGFPEVMKFVDEIVSEGLISKEGLLHSLFIGRKQWT